MSEIVITWSQAEQLAKHTREKQLIHADQKLEEFLTSDLGMLDAIDIAYYSECTGIDPMSLRRLHNNRNLETLLHTFIGDDSDMIINIY